MEWRSQQRCRPPPRKSPQRVIVLSGLPGSGKTTLAQQLQDMGWVWVNQDTLGSKRACEDAYVHALAAGREVVVDRCNFDISQRSTWVRLARKFGATVVSLQLTTPIKECIRRAQARPDHPTLQGKDILEIISRFASEFVPTQQGEGFADIYTAKDVDEIARFVAFIGPAQLMFSSRSASVAPYDSAFAQSPGQHQPQPMGWHARPPIHAIPSYFGCGPQAQPQASPWNGKPAPWASGVVYGQHQSQQKQQWRPPLQQQQQHPAQQRVQRVSPSSEASPHNPQAGSERSSIVPFPGKSGNGSRSWHANNVSEKTMIEPHFLDITIPRAPADTRPIALFDLNGTLTSHTAKRKSAGINKMRPGIHHLMRLHDTFRIGVFTSASSKTVGTVVPMLERAAGSNGRPLLAEKDLILSRNHTVAAPKSHISNGGNTWDTVKPLHMWFMDLSRVFLVDDDAYKAVEGEEDNMVVVPGWESNDDDTVLAALTDALLDIMGALSPNADVRRYTKAVQEAVALRVGRPAGSGAAAANPEKIDLSDAEDCKEEELKEHPMPAEPPAAEDSHLVLA